MKTRSFAFFLLTHVLSVLLQAQDGSFKHSFENSYEAGRIELKIKYRKDLAAYIRQNATSFEFLLLGDPVRNQTMNEHEFPGKFFYVDGKGDYYHIKSGRLWSGKDAKLLKDLIAKTIVDASRDVPMSHTPRFGLRIYTQKEVFFQTSICTKSDNWCLTFPGHPSDHEWLSLKSEDFSQWFPPK